MSARSTAPGSRSGIGLLLFALLLLPAHSPQGAEFADELRDGGWTWHDPQRFTLPDAQLRTQHFRAPLPPVEVARRLGNLPSGRLRRLQLDGSGLTLSGLAQGAHWVVRLVPDGTGTAGLVSSLVPGAPDAGRFDARRFAPADARQVLHVASEHGTLVRLDCAGPLDAVLEQVSALLAAGQWHRPDSGPQGVPASLHEWRHPSGASLTTLFEARGDRVSLTFWQRSKESP